MLTIELIGSIFAAPMWSLVSKHTDQRISWMLSVFLTVPVMVLAFLYLKQGDAVFYAFYCFWIGMTESGASFLLSAMRISVIDYDNLYLRQRREGVFSVRQ